MPKRDANLLLEDIETATAALKRATANELGFTKASSLPLGAAETKSLGENDDPKLD